MSILAQFYLFPKSTFRESENEVLAAISKMHTENDELKARITEIETLYHGNVRCQCSDDDACKMARKIAELEAIITQQKATDEG